MGGNEGYVVMGGNEGYVVVGQQGLCCSGATGVML
jgi:hypothetical protein